MENPQPKRHLKLHRSTWVVGAIALILGCLIVLPGLGVEYSLNASPQVVSVGYEHGWPYPFLKRTASGSSQPLCGVPWLSWEAWQVWYSHGDNEFSFRNLMFDTLVLMASVVMAIAAWEWRLRRSRLMQISLAGLMVLITLVALPLGWYTYHRTEVKREQAHVIVLDNEYGDAFVSVRVPDYAMPKWLERLVGWQILPEIKFSFVKTAMLLPQNSGFSAKLEETLPHLLALKRMETLMLEVPTSSDQRYFRLIAQLRQLREVKLSGKGVLDLQLAEHAVQLQQIKRLEVGFKQGVTSEARKLLSERMPDCTVKFFGDD